MKDSERKGRMLTLWLMRPARKRREEDVLEFYGVLERLHPELLNRRGGDAYQNLISDLQGHIEPSDRR